MHGSYEGEFPLVVQARYVPLEHLNMLYQTNEGTTVMLAFCTGMKLGLSR